MSFPRLRTFFVFLTFAALPLSIAAQPVKPSSATLDHYLAAQTALAAGDAAAAQRALSAIDDRTVRAAIASLPADAKLSDVRHAFHQVAEAAAQWDLPADMVLMFCSDPAGGGLWVQRGGNAENPFGAAGCGAPLVRDQITVRGYLNTYAVGESDSATRIKASLLEIPLSVKAVTHDVLVDQNVTDVNDAFKNAPEVTAQVGYLRPNYYLMRGFYGLNYRDGIREPIDGTVTINPFELERIEVLKGPSSILYGKGDPGGVINFQSKRPASAFGGQAIVNSGSNSMRRGDFDITGALTERLAGRLILSTSDANSYRAEVTDKSLYVNPSLRFDANAKNSLWLTGEYVSDDAVPDQGVFLRPGGVVPAFSTRSRFFGDPTDRSKITSSRLQGEYQMQVSPTWTFRAVAGTQRNHQKQLDRTYTLIDSGPTGYAGLLPPNLLYQIHDSETPNRKHYTGRVENFFTIDSGSMRHQLLVGADYRDETESIPQRILDHDLLDYTTGQRMTSIFGLPIGAGLFFDQKTDTHFEGKDLGIAAQDLIELGSNWNILAGVRYERDRVTSTRTGYQLLNAVLGGTPVSLDAFPDAATSNNVAPRLGVLYRITPETSVYGSYLSSFISPVPGQLTKQGNPLKPERAGQWELGFKTAIVPQRLMGTIAAYQITKRDAFVFYPLYAENAGRERSRGLELDLTGAITPEINLTAGYSYIDQVFLQGDPALVGNTREGVPKNSYNLWAAYNPRALRGLTFGAGVYSIGEVWANFTNTAKLSGYTIVDAMAAYQYGAWRAQVNLNNLGNTLGYSPTAGFDGGRDPNLDPLTALPTPPRRVTVNLSYIF